MKPARLLSASPHPFVLLADNAGTAAIYPEELDAVASSEQSACNISGESEEDKVNVRSPRLTSMRKVVCGAGIGLVLATVGVILVHPKAGMWQTHEVASSPSALGKLFWSDGACPDGCGDDRETWRCVVVDRSDRTESQCIDCNPDGNWVNECVYWDRKKRKEAVKACGLPCGDMEVPDGYEAMKEPCRSGLLIPDYGSERCYKEDDGSLQISCEHRYAAGCGAHFSEKKRRGAGTYSVDMQGAYGPGVSTSMSLYNYGFNKDRKLPWNEVNIHILGMQCSEEESTIATSFLASDDFDDFAEYWHREKEYRKYVYVPFDACADWHTYKLEVSEKHISWIVDDKVYRKEDITDFPDLRKTITDSGLQLQTSLWAQESAVGTSGWNKMGIILHSEEDFPLYAWMYPNDFEDCDDCESEGEDSSKDSSEDSSESDLDVKALKRYTGLTTLDGDV